MIIICSECKVYIGKKPPHNDPSVIYSICLECQKKAEKKVKRE